VNTTKEAAEAIAVCRTIRSVTTPCAFDSSMVSNTTAGAEAIVTAAVAAAQAGLCPISRRAKEKIRMNERLMSISVLRSSSGLCRSQPRSSRRPTSSISSPRAASAIGRACANASMLIQPSSDGPKMLPAST